MSKTFDLAKAMANGGKCQTRDGRPVRIICADAQDDDGDTYIVALVWKGDYEAVDTYCKQGSYFRGSDGDHRDLVNSPVKREGWVNINGPYEEVQLFSTKETADALAPRHRKACVRIEWEE